MSGRDGMMGAEGRRVMQIRQAQRGHGHRLPTSACLATVVMISALALTACGHAAGKTGAANAAKQCGTSHTAANVPVTVQVNSGQISCSTALTVENDYAKAIDEGKAPGNGGGGPVPVDGWTCQGFPTPEVLKTGNASKCVKGHTEILATLSTSA
jgi:hypothetical protein